MRYAALFVLLLAVASPAASQAVDDKAVVPGTRIGRLALEMPIQDLMRMNWPASARSSIVATFIPEATWVSWDSLGLAAGTHDRKRTDYLAVYRGSDYRTQRGVGHRASRKTVVSAYGEPTVEGDLFVQGRIITMLAYDKIGLAFFLHGDVVEVLLIFRPGELVELIISC
ncbi:MAG: hypothetical protein ACT4PY_07520 [Armatimonadota bacterium]